MKETSCSLTFACVWVAANLLCCGAAFAQSPTHADVSYGAGQEVVDMYLAESETPTLVYIWGHAKGQTYKRIPRAAVSLCLEAGYSFLSIEANDANNDGIEDLYNKEPWIGMLDFIIANGAKYNIDTENVFIGGRSLGSMGSFTAAMERWEDVRGIYSMQALPTGGAPHAALVHKNAPPCSLIYRSAPGSNNHDPLNGLMVQDAYEKHGMGDRFVIKTEIPDRQWFDGFVEFMEANRAGSSGQERRAGQSRRRGGAAPAQKSQKTTQQIAPTYGNVKYGIHERNVLDFYQAKSETPTPVAVYIHGGGFRKGSKDLLHRWYPDVLEKCLEAGVSVAAINYRFHDTASLPEIFRDTAHRTVRP